MIIYYFLVCNKTHIRQEIFPCKVFIYRYLVKVKSCFAFIGENVTKLVCLCVSFFVKKLLILFYTCIWQPNFYLSHKNNFYLWKYAFSCFRKVVFCRKKTCPLLKIRFPLFAPQLYWHKVWNSISVCFFAFLLF